jgi:serine/threonine protein kinase
LDIDGYAYLSDFGLCKYLKEEEKFCGLIGTLEYMAPEVINIKPYDRMADI